MERLRPCWGGGRNLRNATRGEVREVGRNRAPFAPARVLPRTVEEDVRNLCTGSVSTRVSFTGICLFHNGDPALHIPPLPKSYSGVGVTGPFSLRVTRVRVPAAHAPARPPQHPRPLPRGRRWRERGFGGASPSPHAPRASPRAKHKAPWVGGEGNSESTGTRGAGTRPRNGRVLPGRSPALPEASWGIAGGPPHPKTGFSSMEKVKEVNPSPEVDLGHPRTERKSSGGVGGTRSAVPKLS